VTSAPYVSGQTIQVDGMAVSVSGAPASGDSFEIVPSTSTLSVFDALDKAVGDLATPRRTGWVVAQSNADNLRNIDSVLNTLQASRAYAGAVLNQIDAETDRLSGMKLTAQTVRSNAEDVDMVAAISTFQNRQSGYDAALKSYSMVQRLSLFQYLGG
jgi:flagellar hook-associated protein 3 FlgL